MTQALTQSFMNSCPVCGKRHVIMWPDMYVYRRGPTYYCSEDCMIVAAAKDQKIIKMIAHMRAKKGSKNMMKLTLEQKKKAVEIALSGKNPLNYLKECGIKAPDKTWYAIKAALKEKDPELYARIPDFRKAYKETPEQAPTVKVDGPIRIETPEANKVEVVETPETPRISSKSEKPRKITVPVAYDGLIIREVEGKFGRYRRSDIGSATYIDFESADGMDTLSFTVEQWRSFREEHAKASGVLGVEM